MNNMSLRFKCIKCAENEADVLKRFNFSKGGSFTNTTSHFNFKVPICNICSESFSKRKIRKNLKLKKGELLIQPDKHNSWIPLKRWLSETRIITEDDIEAMKKRVENKFLCPKCGKEQLGGTDFCRFCGKDLRVI
jgi:predicted RNA-binding Zn-ribbon protein involved in translation (DUF1610 family)